MTTQTTSEPTASGGCAGCGQSATPEKRCCESPESCELECLERPLFTAGMVLSDTDLTALTDWTGARLGLNRHRDGWGVVCGLDVHCDPDRPGSVVVEPGYAVGCCGEDVVLCESQQVDLAGCCRVDSPCQDPVEDPKDPKDSTYPKVPRADRDPCGDVVVDIVVSPLASPAVPELVDTCGCGCGSQEPKVVPTRLREGGLVEPVRVAFPHADPREAAAERAQATYRRCHSILRSWVEAGQKGDPSREDVVAWLRQQRIDPPCDWWDVTCAELAHADGPGQVDAVMATALLDLVVACRHRLLRRPCGTCTDDHIGLARVWLRRVEGNEGEHCVVTRVDAYRPHRRELGHTPRPVPAGAEDLAPFIWQRWDQVCPLWRRLAPVAEPMVEELPTTTAELLRLLDETDRLWWACADPAPEPVVVRVPCLGDRVIGFRERKRRPEPVHEPVGEPVGELLPAPPAHEPERPVDTGVLEDVRGIGPAYARRLHESGTSTIEELTLLEPSAIAKVLNIGEPLAKAIWHDAAERVRSTR